MSGRELTKEELAKATGGKRKQTAHGLQDGGSAGAGSGSQVQIDDVDELDDSPTAHDPRG